MALHARDGGRSTGSRPGTAGGPLKLVPVPPYKPATGGDGFQGVSLRGPGGLIDRPKEVPEPYGGAGLPEGFCEGFCDRGDVCNGHNTEPRIAECPGIQRWPGKQIHSHNYRTPEPFKDLVVVLIGYGTSSVDISLETAPISKEVHLAIRGPSKIAMHDRGHGFSNIWFHPMIKHAQEDGAIVFEDGTSIYADVILHCTGYKYHFPFLDMDGVVRVDDNRVGPLYKHVFPPLLAPCLSFIGLLSKGLPFRVSELQSKWVAGVLSGRISLPSVEEMMEDVDNFYAQLEAAGVPKHHTHVILTSLVEYNDWLADQCGLPGMEEWEKIMLFAAYESLQNRPGTFRDEWKDDDLASKGCEDFVRSISG
ncbi:hypothetical protein SAY87_020552 [Trapa incisa]|uniref:Flavin-containing monooxygenase n=1 Tax=Trapa incisa TaxID=236973 RepID=A0AAN7JQ09_9MYRT|nr:hypothetical protein SAY87_020552 [Trapa incisa]